MPYTRITPSRNGREAIAYALGEEDAKGHNGNDVRNLYVCSVGLTPNQPPSFADQMNEYWMQASSRNKNQVRRIITSYSKEELDPDDPKSAYIAGEIAREHAKKYYPGRQVLICVQKDGVGGCLHTHALVNNVSYIDLKGCTDEQTKFHYVAKTMDETAKQFIELKMDYADKWDEVTGRAILPKDKVNQNVRRMRDVNREAIANGEEPPHYIWEDDLKNRVRQAMEEATSRDDFEKRLTAHGVEIGRSGSSKKYGEYFTYELVDTTGFDEPPKKEAKVRSYNLGDDFTPESLDRMIAEKQSSKNFTTEPAYTYKLPVKKELTSEELAEKKKREAEADKFVDWCSENGYTLMKNGMYDLDKAEIARKAYQEAMLKAKDVENEQHLDSSKDMLEYEDDEPILRRSRRKKEYESSASRRHRFDYLADEIKTERISEVSSEEVQEKEADMNIKNYELVQKVLNDAQQLDDEKEEDKVKLLL